MYLVKVIVALVYLSVKYKAKINSKTQMVGHFNMCVKQRLWCASSVPMVSEKGSGQSQGVG